MRSLIPILDWLPRYERSWLRADIMAGLAVWAMTVPQALAYAGIAGVPPIYGLYTVPVAMIAYAIFGTSRTLSVGPESAIAIISAVTVGALAVADPSQFLALTSALTLVVGVLFLIFGLLRLGWAASFLSQPVLQGFTQGIALIVIASQIPVILGTSAAFAGVVAEYRGSVWQLFGMESNYSGFLLQIWAILATLAEANLATAAIGLVALALLFALKRIQPLAPSALIAVLLSVLAVSLFGLKDHGVSVIGEVETGMVSLSVPSVDLGLVMTLLPGAFAIVLLGYSISLSVAAISAKTTGEQIDPNQELLGLGVANLGAAASSGFVVCGSLSRGVVVRRAGGRTQVVSLVNATLIFLTLLFVLPLFFNLPSATLSAIVVQAMLGIVNFGYFRKLYRIDRSEFAYAMAALFGVLVLGIMQGVALGVLLAILVLIRQVTQPGSAVLGQMPGTSAYRDTEANPQAEAIPGLLIFRFDAPVIFVNAGSFANRVRTLIDEAAIPVRRVLVAAHQINHLDSTGADQLARLNDELEGKGITLSFAEVKNPLREAMQRTGLEEQVGQEQFHKSIDEAVQAFSKQQGKESG